MQKSIKTPEKIRSNHTIVIDDDSTVGRLIEAYLKIKTYSFCSEQALSTEVSKYDPLAIFIDIFLSEHQNGLDIIPELRRHWPLTVIIVMTSGEDEGLISQAFSGGADDFLRKPINGIEINERLKVRLKDYSQKIYKRIIQFADLCFDVKYNYLYGNKGGCFLADKEAILLAELVIAKGRIIPKRELKGKIWSGLAVSNNALDRKVFELRRAIEKVSNNIYVHSTYGEGISLSTKLFGS